MKDRKSNLLARTHGMAGVRGWQAVRTLSVDGSDLFVVSEADDENAATAFALGTAAQGNVRSVTMRAWDPDAFEQIVSMIP